MAAVRFIGDELTRRADLGYESLAVARNGRLYAAPYYALQVLEIDPAAGTTRFIGDELPGDCKYSTLVAASNGRLYAAPSRRTACGNSSITCMYPNIEVCAVSNPGKAASSVQKHL